MKAKERIDFIRNAIEADGQAKVTELSRECGVTEETLRRDLDKLERQGYITRTHGGAVWNSESQREGIHFFSRQAKNASAKRKIGLKAVDYAGPYRTIMADSSSTVLETLKMLSDRQDLTIVTNSAEALHELRAADFQLISTGGTYNKKSLSFQGELAKDNLRHFNCEAAFISCKGIDMSQGIFDSYESEADIKRVMINQVRDVILLADHTKFGQSAFLKLTELERIDCIITDQKPNEEWITFCAECNILLLFPDGDIQLG